MKLARLISDILVGHNNVFNYDQIHIINSEHLSKSNFKPVCKENIAYIVGIVLINDKNEVCLIQEAKSSCKGKWYIPAGRMEKNETLIEAAIREAKEETGYLIEPLSVCCVEIGHLAMWYRFTFLARIVGGSLKTHDEADSESLQAEWFSLDNLNDRNFLKILRSLDFIDTVKIASNYYNKYRINSLTHLSDSEFIKLRDCHNLILPSLNAHKHLIFTFVMLNEDLTSCLLYENKTNIVLPSVYMLPDVYKNTYLNNRVHPFEFVINSLLLPACFKNSKEIKYSNRCVLTVDYNGKKQNRNEEITDGIQFIFLIRVFADKNEPRSNSAAAMSSSLEPNNSFVWSKFDNVQFIEDIKQKLEQPYHFIDLQLNGI